MYAKITVVGHLGNDPEIRHLPSGTINGNFSVATNRPSYTDKQTGEVVKPEPTWFRVVAYQTTEKGLVTEVIQKWLKKGQLVFVEGEPRIRKYTDKEGVVRYAFEIHLGPQSVIKMLGGGNGNKNSHGEGHEPGRDETPPATPGHDDAIEFAKANGIGPAPF